MKPGASSPREEVFAITPMVTAAASGSVDFLLDENVPFFGWGIDPAFCGNEIGFGFTGCVTDPNLQKGSNALGTVLKENFDGDSDKTVSIIGDDSDSGKGGLRLLTASLEDVGFTVPFAEATIPAPPATTSDFTPFVNDLMTSDDGGEPDVILVQLSNLDAAGLAGALKAAGFEGLIITPLYSPLLLGSEQAASDLDATATLVQIQPYEVEPKPEALQQMLDDVEAVSPGESLGLGLAAGYWAVDMFLSILEATGEDLTVETFLQTANDDFGWEAEGVIGPSSWPTNHDQPVPCAALPLVSSGAYVPNVDLTCGEVIDVE
ncbi:MAG: ABC transporter substrate-binding protein [Acidimicrobiia bacterium]|nr:ABC transporter substrate-binding protein [Acidimicrobiia bacterium]